MSARRTCPECGKRRAISRFTLSGPTRQAKIRQTWCDDCKRAWYTNHNFRMRYGITLEEYDEMVEAQGGRCACCGDELGATPGKGERFHVDHCHATGRVRGLLCQGCNIAIGHLKDCADRAMKAAEYLRAA